MFKLFAKRSVLKLWIWSCSALLLIPLISSAYVVANVNNALNTELINNNTALLNNMRGALDGAFIEIEYIRDFLRRNNDVSAMSFESELSPQTIFTLLTSIRDTLRLTMENCKYVGDVYIYFPNLDYVISTDVFYESRLFYQRNINGEDNGYDEWKQFMQDCTAMAMSEEITPEGKETVEIIVPVGDYDRYIINVLIEKSVLFRDVITAYPNRSSIAVVFSGSGKLLFQYGLTNEVNLRELNLKNEFEIHNLRFGSKKMNVSYIRSSINRYRYFYASPSSEVSKGIQNTILTIILSTCVAIALMLMLLYYFGRWNYSSLRQIIDNSVKSDAIHIDDNSNEYLIISNWIESMKEQRESLKGNTEKLRNIQKQSFLFDYIKGYVDNTKMSGEFQQYDISFPYECFAIVAINVKNIETSKIDILRNAIFIIDNITSDLADDSIHLTDIEADGMLYYIVNAPKDLDVEANMRQLFLYIAAFLRKNFEFTFLTTISTSAYSVHELPRLYREAFSAMEYGIYYEIDEFVSYSEIKNEGHSHFLDACRIPNESSLLYAIKNSRYDEAVEIICNLLSQNANGKHLQEWQLNCLTYNLINSIIKSLDYAEKEALDKIFNYTAMIANCSNINELKTFFEELIKLCVECNLAQIKTEDSTYQKIKNFIEQNITNTVLSPVWIGQKLNLSPTHILRLFKNHNGIKLNSYLNARRIELAKEILLRNRNLKVDVVAMSVGFLNVRTFLATFKEIEGITPTQYRSVNK